MAETLHAHAAITPVVAEIIAELLHIDKAKISEDTRLEALGIDSVSGVELLYQFEEHFNVNIPFNANLGGEQEFALDTVGAISAGIERLLAQKKS